ncbi:Dethiobiotin synthetase [hydrothermal vent metagenome]|uniref:Dethiobiotin synthetase n=1 Tax=hydrothermal vent metagenome TaxID=652676 RepID=A0A1W1EL79_9ZZZZ
MKPIFITATNTNVGKTYTSIKLIEELSNMGFKVGVFKPIETGVDNIPQDASLLLDKVKLYNNNFKNLTPFDITAYTFKIPSAPFCANRDINISKIIDKYKELDKLCDILIVEGAGGLLVPIKENYFMIDLAKELNSNILLVTSSKLGTINDTLLSMEALNSRKMKFIWGINLYQDLNSFDLVSKPFFKSNFNNYLTIQDDIDKIIKVFIK